jgi:hypothetical protein
MVVLKTWRPKLLRNGHCSSMKKGQKLLISNSNLNKYDLIFNVFYILNQFWG